MHYDGRGQPAGRPTAHAQPAGHTLYTGALCPSWAQLHTCCCVRVRAPMLPHLHARMHARGPSPPGVPARPPSPAHPELSMSSFRNTLRSRTSLLALAPASGRGAAAAAHVR